MHILYNILACIELAYAVFHSITGNSLHPFIAMPKCLFTPNAVHCISVPHGMLCHFRCNMLHRLTHVLQNVRKHKTTDGTAVALQCNAMQHTTWYEQTLTVSPSEKVATFFQQRNCKAVIECNAHVV